MINITDLDGQAHSIDLDNLGNVALRMDCMELMKALPDKAFQLAICDPPYGIGANKMTLGNGKTKIFRGSDDWDKCAPPSEYFKELQRVSVNQIIWGANHFTETFHKNSPCWIFWDKGTGDNDFADGEYAYTSFQTHARKFFLSWVGANAKDKNESRIHPTQKPIELYAWLLHNYAHKGDRILDTHLGSGSSRIAAWQAGYNFLGTEIDQDYFKAQEERYISYSSQMKLWED